MFVRAAVLGATFAVVAGSTHAQPVPSKAIVAVRASGPIAIDGALAEAAWQTIPISDFRQKEPAENAEPTHPTEVRVTYDDHALYVGARMWDAPGGTRRSITRRDETTGAERFIVSVDPYRTGRIAYSFAVTVAGVRADWIHTDDSETIRDSTWNPVWSAKTRVLHDGWAAEMRIPWTQLRYPRDGAPPWGINFNRYIPDRNEDVFWIVVPSSQTAWSSQMGELRGLERLPRRLGIELVPYLVASLSAVDNREPDPGGTVGLDAKIGLGSALSLDLAINPDFGQVEADPAMINLSAFEVALAERRPFFVAGSEILRSGPVSYFYSRRVGAVPGAALPTGTTEVPDTVPILAAAKISGRVGDRATLGALVAITDDADVTTGTGTQPLAPRTAWGVARMEREFGSSRVGASVAAVARDLRDSGLVAVLPRFAGAGGVDALHRWANGEWELGGYAGGSVVTGDDAAIARVQTSSSHYFQRPGATHKWFDPTRTTLLGWHAGLWGGRRAGSLRLAGTATLESPGFDLNGPGLLAEADEISGDLELAWYDTTPSNRWQSWHLGVDGSANWNWAGDLRQALTSVTAAATTRGFADLGATIGIYSPGLSDTLTRGGPLMRSGGGAFTHASVGKNRGTDLTWSLSLDAEHAPLGATVTAVGAAIGVRISDHLRLSLSPRVYGGIDRRQYVATVDDPAATSTFGHRYVFGAVDLLEVSSQVRAAITVSPDVAIDLYVEPFVARGRFHNLGELAAPSSSDLRPYTTVRRNGAIEIVERGFTLPEPDFTARSVRSTAVLRWEPRPGSTLYAVWQQDRSSRDTRRRPLDLDLLDAFSAPGGHLFALKLAWWFAR